MDMHNGVVRICVDEREFEQKLLLKTMLPLGNTEIIVPNFDLPLTMGSNGDQNSDDGIADISGSFGGSSVIIVGFCHSLVPYMRYGNVLDIVILDTATVAIINPETYMQKLIRGGY